MAVPTTNNPCPRCEGTGDDGSGFCLGCLGSGFMSSTGTSIFFKKFFDDTMDKLKDNKEKLDEIKTVVDQIKVLIETP